MNTFYERDRYGIEEGYITLSNDDLKICCDAIENMPSSNDISISMLSSTVSLILYSYLYLFIHRSTYFNEVMNSTIEINELGNLYHTNNYMDIQEMNHENFPENENENHRDTNLPEEFSDAFCFDEDIRKFDNVLLKQGIYY